MYRSDVAHIVDNLHFFARNGGKGDRRTLSPAERCLEVYSLLSRELITLWTNGEGQHTAGILGWWRVLAWGVSPTTYDLVAALLFLRLERTGFGSHRSTGMSIPRSTSRLHG